MREGLQYSCSLFIMYVCYLYLLCTYNYKGFGRQSRMAESKFLKLLSQILPGMNLTPDLRLFLQFFAPCYLL
jgi:hypothetical protein